MTDDRPPAYRGEDTRQGDIVLRSRRRRIVFFGGLIGIVVLLVLLRLLAA